MLLFVFLDAGSTSLTDSQIKLQVGIFSGKSSGRDDRSRQEQRVADVPLHDNCAVTTGATSNQTLWILSEENSITLRASVWLDAVFPCR